MARQTTVGIADGKFTINGRPVYEGRTWRGHSLEGLLLNSRMVQGIFDDLNPETRGLWDYPDGPWDPQRNTAEFIQHLPVWREHGLLGFTINLQGGSPQGYSNQQPWHNSAITAEGDLQPESMNRLKAILDRADELGMIPILGIFYFGQDERVADETAILRAVDHTLDWVFDQGYTNAVIEIDNECNVKKYEHEILMPARVHELILRAKAHTRDGRRLLVSTSYGGGKVPEPNVVESADFLLLHGNGVSDPNRIRQMVRQTRDVAGYRGQPILFNEDDHFNFEQDDNNFIAAVESGAGWGYFDFRMKDEGYDEGYQSVPVNWGLSSERKRGFFGLLKEMTGGG
jgi:hypothetical protein